jgi:hypothetical protein
VSQSDLLPMMIPTSTAGASFIVVTNPIAAHHRSMR